MKVVHLCLSSFYPDNYPQIESLEEKEDKNETKSMKQNISTFCFLGSGLKIALNEKNVPKNNKVMPVFRYRAKHVIPYKTSNGKLQYFVAITMRDITNG